MCSVGVLTAFTWLKIWYGDGFLWTPSGISWPCEQLSVAQEEFCSMKLVEVPVRKRFSVPTGHCFNYQWLSVTVKFDRNDRAPWLHVQATLLYPVQPLSLSEPLVFIYPSVFLSYCFIIISPEITFLPLKWPVNKKERGFRSYLPAEG
jgi:hypothetical protein